MKMPEKFFKVREIIMGEDKPFTKEGEKILKKKRGIKMTGFLITTIIITAFIGGAIIIGRVNIAQNGRLLSKSLSEPLNNVKAARFDINADAANLTIDDDADKQLLAGGEVQYFEGQGLPISSLAEENGRSILMLKSNKAPVSAFRFPWDACRGGAYKWQIHLNHAVCSDINAYSSGGDILLNLDETTLTRLTAATGGGNVNAVLSEKSVNAFYVIKTGGGNVDVALRGTAGSSALTAESGAGNVSVSIPNDTEARIRATAGLGKVVVDSRFTKVNGDTYQSSGYDKAANKFDIMLKSGAGNVSVVVK